MSWQEWIVWAIFAVVVVVVWRWLWRLLFCRAHRCEECRHGHCGLRDKEWEKAHDKLNRKANADSKIDPKRRIFLLCVTSWVLTACGEEAATQCYLEGTVVGRPDARTLYLYQHINGALAAHHTKPIKIPIRKGKFSYRFPMTAPDYCTLIFADELQRGYWHEIGFMADCDTVRFLLHDAEHLAENRIEGRGATAEYEGYQQQFKALRMTSKRHVDSLKAAGQYYMPKFAALNEAYQSAAPDSEEWKRLYEARRDVPEQERYTASYFAERARFKQAELDTYLRILDQEPTPARLALLARQFCYQLPDAALVELYYRRYATACAGDPTQEFIRRQISGLQIGVGSQYLDFELPDTDGVRHRFSEMTADAKLIVLNLWSSWCGSCRRHAMELIPLYERYRDRGFVVVGVAREEEDTHVMEQAVRRDGYPWPQLVELNNETHLWECYGIGSAGGRLLVIAPSGEILAIYPTVEEMRQLLETYCQ